MAEAAVKAAASAVVSTVSLMASFVMPVLVANHELNLVSTWKKDDSGSPGFQRKDKVFIFSN